jgi:APA family basic amino acid/polyamine antiporter
MPAPSAAVAPRQISLPTATSLVIANMIGTGIFTSLHFQVRDLPSGFTILFLWALGGLCALCGALAYGELAAALPRSGGEYHFLSRIFHPAAGFLAGWISATVGFAAPIALAAMAFGRYFAHVLPNVSPLTMSLTVALGIAMVHLAGITLGSAFQNVATFLKVVLILTLIVAGALALNLQPISFRPARHEFALIASTPFAISLVYVMYAYSGWNASTYIVGEIRAPARNVPLSLVLGTGLVTILYVALNATFLRNASLHELQQDLEIGQVAAAHIFGEGGGRIMAGLISLGLISSISAMTWVGPRVAMVLGEDCHALRWLAYTARNGAPSVAIALQTIIVVVLLITATFAAVVNYIQFSLALCSFFTVLGVIVLRVREPNLPRPVRMWGYPFTPLLFLAVNAWMLWHIAGERFWESCAGLATMALGLALYALSRQNTSPH